MKYNPSKCHRKSVRLKEYDYSQAGAYFITICTYGGKCLFGNINKGKMRLNNYGIMLKREWLRTSEMRLNILLDEFIIMPNHIHGIIMVVDKGRGTLQRAPTIEQFGKPVSNSIPTIIRLFKAITTKQLNRVRHTPGFPIWQRNYYEHVIRNEDDLRQIREYIVNNPLKWDLDSENPENIKPEKLIA